MTKTNTKQEQDLEVRDLEAFCVKLAKKAGNLVSKMRQDANTVVSYKSPHDLVTNADLAAENLIIEAIKTQFPDHIILAEETASNLDPAAVCDSDCWIVDPIDGTMNYSFEQHHTCVSIAYAKNGVVLVGVVYAPFYDEIFAATKGQGATLNGKLLTAKPVEDYSKALICTGRPKGRDYIDEFTDQLNRIYKTCLDTRRVGAAALDICWIAANRHNAFFENLSPWDISAARLIAREAGAEVGHYTSAINEQKSEYKANWPEDLNSQFILVTSPGLFQPLKSIIENY